MNKRITLLAMVFCMMIGAVNAQVSITTISQVYTQDFNTLANTGATSSVLPTGWNVSNNVYSIGTGSGTSGAIYSYGATNATDRALGTLATGSLPVALLGCKFTNNTGSTITSFTLSYMGEMWRLGSTGGPSDTLYFEYTTASVDSVHHGSWTGVSALNFVTPDTTGATGARDGNASLNRTFISSVVGGLNITNGSTFWIRWQDKNSLGTDDGLSVDSLKLTFSATALPACVAPAASPTNLVLTPAATSIGGSFTPTTADKYLVVYSTSATLGATPANATIYNAGDNLGSGKVVQSGSGTSFTQSGLLSSTQYYFFVFPFNDACTGGPAYRTTALSGNSTTLVAPCAEPTGKPTNMVFTTVNNTTIVGKFNKLVPAPAGYVVVFSTSSNVAYPLDSTTYNVGDSIKYTSFKSKVVSVGTDSNFTISGLLQGTRYYVAVVPFSNCPGGPNYNRTAPLRADTVTTGIAAPTDCTQPSGVSNTSIIKLDSTTTTISIKWTNPSNADSVLVAAGPLATIGFVDVRDSAVYAVNSTIPGSGAKVYYRGTDSSLVLTGLTINTVYKIVIATFNNKGCLNGPNYSGLANKTIKTAAGAAGDCVQPSGVSNTSIVKLDSTTTTISIKWTNPANADSVLVAAGPLATIGFVDVRDSAIYAVNSTIPGSGAKVYYRGTDSSLVLTGLTINTVYKIVIATFNNKGCANGPNYSGLANKTIKTAAGAAGDCVQPSGVSNTSIKKVDSTGTTISIKWTNPANADSVLVAAGPLTTIGFVDVRDSVIYAVNSTIPGSGAKVYYRGTDSSLVLTGLTPNTVYKIVIATFNNKGCANGPNYSGLANTTIKTAVSTGVKYSKGTEFIIYPNPVSNGLLNVQFKQPLADEAVMEVIDITGRKLMTQQVGASVRTQTIDVTGFSKGLYLINIWYKNENSTVPFMVE